MIKAKDKDYGFDGTRPGVPVLGVKELADVQKDALATLVAIRSEKPDEDFWKVVFEAEQAVGTGALSWNEHPYARVPYYKSQHVRSALSLLYRKYVTEEVLEPLEFGPDPKVIDIDHPFLTTVEAEYDRAMMYEGKREKEREYAFAELLVRLDPEVLGEDQRPDDWGFVPWWTEDTSSLYSSAFRDLPTDES